MNFVIEKKSYVSKSTGEKKFAFNMFLAVNGINLPVMLKGDTTALIISHQLLENSSVLINLPENAKLEFEVTKNEK